MNNHTTKVNTFLRIWLPMILWASLIFSFSSQPYEKQDLRSFIKGHINEQRAEKFFADIHINYAGKEINLKNKGVEGVFEFFIRKGAHFIVYMLLGVLILRVLLRLHLPFYQRYIIAIITGILYAISDEWHQSFTIHRTPLVADVILDSIGVLIGITIFIIMKHLIKGKSGLS